MGTSHAPAISVLMTAFNREQYIGAAIESVLVQTFADWELVIVDDCSRDRTVDIAMAYASRDQRIRVHVNDRNLGDYPNRNRAATLARGHFMKYHDSDDLMYPHCLQIMHDYMVGEPGAAFAMTGPRYWSGGPGPMLVSPQQAYQREFLGGGGLFGLGPACALFRTAAFHDLGGFSAEYGIVADYIFWMRACTRVSVLLVPADLFWYRVHPGQELNRPLFSMQSAALGAPAWDILFSPDCPLEGMELEQARRNLAWSLTRDAVREAQAGRWRCARMRLAGMSLWQLLRYCRRVRIDRWAGVPRDANGEFLPPWWLPAGVTRTANTCTES